MMSESKDQASSSSSLADSTPDPTPQSANPSTDQPVATADEPDDEPEGEIPESGYILFLSGKSRTIKGNVPVTSSMIAPDTVTLTIEGKSDFDDYDPEATKRMAANGFILSKGVFPESLKVLEITSYPLKEPFVSGVLPSGLKKLEWGCNTSLLPGTLPEGLLHLALEHSFNLPIAKGVLTKSLKVLEFSNDSYNQRLIPGALPEGLKRLILPEMFNQPIEPGVIPASLTTLVMDCKYYNYPFKKGTFPVDSQLTNLIISARHFNQPFEVGSLPDGLFNLDLSGTQSFDQPFRKGVLPRELKILKLGRAWSRPLTATMFESCQDLELLTLNYVEHWDHPIKAGVLAPKLRGLYLPDSFSHKIKASMLPSTLEYLSISDHGLVQGKLPAGCKLSGCEDGDEDDEGNDHKQDDEVVVSDADEEEEEEGYDDDDMTEAEERGMEQVLYSLIHLFTNMSQSERVKLTKRMVKDHLRKTVEGAEGLIVKFKDHIDDLIKDAFQSSGPI